MTVSILSLLFDGMLACLLAVMIFYAVQLNKRIVMLRSREDELQSMITQFAHSSANAQESADRLRAAGNEAEFNVKASVAKGMALRNDLELMIEQAAALIEKIAEETERQASVKDVAQRVAKAPDMPLPAQPSAGPVQPFRPPPGPADAPRVEPAPQPASGVEPRTDAERQLLEAIRAAKQGVA